MSYNLQYCFNVNCFYLSSLNVSDEDVIISRTFRYSSGSDQQFQQSDYIVTPSDMDSDKLTYDPENDQHRFPLVILMQTTSDLSKPHPLLHVPWIVHTPTHRQCAAGSVDHVQYRAGQQFQQLLSQSTQAEVTSKSAHPMPTLLLSIYNIQNTQRASLNGHNFITYDFLKA